MTEKELMNEAYEWRKHIKNLVTATDDELYHKRSKVFDWLIEQVEKIERYENAIKECIERMNEGGPGTRSFIYEKLTEVMERSE